MDAAVPRDTGVDAEVEVDAAVVDAAMPPISDCIPNPCRILGDGARFCAAPASSTSVEIGDGCAVDGTLALRYGICSCSDLVTNARLEVGGSIAVDEDLQLGPDTSVSGSIFVSGGYDVRSDATLRISGAVNQGAMAECDCSRERVLDIAALVRERASENDNARAGFDATSVNGFTGAHNVVLECGRYYAGRLAGRGSLTLDVRGRVALFVDGNIELSQSLTVILRDGASLDLFVRGNVTIAGTTELGSGTTGRRVLFAVGGTGTIQLDQAARVDGTIYAPNAELVARSTLDVYGSVFARRVALEGVTRVRYQNAQTASCQ